MDNDSNDMKYMDNAQMQDPGAFPPQTPIGMAYVPVQKFRTVFDTDAALVKGTIFPELNKPWLGGKAFSNKSGNSGEMENTRMYGESVSGVTGKWTVSGLAGNGAVSGMAGKGTVSGAADSGTVSGMTGKWPVSGMEDNGTVSGMTGKGTVSGAAGKGTASGMMDNGTVAGMTDKGMASGVSGKWNRSGTMERRYEK